MLVHPVSVFIVDDSPQLTEMLGELFSDPGNIEIAGSADSAKKAIDDIRRSCPDVVIVDLQLKEGDGFDVVKAIRALPQAKDVVIIFFSNHASRELHRHAVALGADFFLDKTKDHAKVLEMLQEIVRARQT